MSNMFTETMW